MAFELPNPSPSDLIEHNKNALRQLRDFHLTACDWTQVPDSALSDEDRAAWRVYRQALRDITKFYSSPSDVVWPLSPVEEQPPALETPE